MTAEEAAAVLHQQVGADKPRAKRSAMSAKQILKICEAAKVMRDTKSWVAAKPGHLVALWAWCHERVYDVAPTEDLQPAQFSRYCIKAALVLRKSFDGNVEQVTGFMRWTWAREQLRFARRDPFDYRRLGAGLHFSSALIGDWRVATAGHVDR